MNISGTLLALLPDACKPGGNSRLGLAAAAEPPTLPTPSAAAAVAVAEVNADGRGALAVALPGLTLPDPQMLTPVVLMCRPRTAVVVPATVGGEGGMLGDAGNELGGTIPNGDLPEAAASSAEKVS